MITKYDVIRKPFLTEKAMMMQEDAKKSAVTRVKRAVLSKDKKTETSKTKRNAQSRKMLADIVAKLDKNAAKTQIEEAAEALVEAKLVFEVHTEATKSEIKKAVEEFFKVKVAHVRTANFKGKEKRFGRTLGRRLKPLNQRQKAFVLEQTAIMQISHLLYLKNRLQKLLNQKAVVTIEAVLQFVTKVAVIKDYTVLLTLKEIKMVFQQQ